MHQMIGRNVKQRLIAQQQMQDHPGSRGTDHHRAQHRRMHIAQDFFEREQHGGDGSVEGGGQRRCTSHRDQRFDALFAETEAPPEYGSDSGADLDRRTLAAECNAAGERGRAAEELPEDGLSEM